jgi:hypothetical protein
MVQLRQGDPGEGAIRPTSDCIVIALDPERCPALAEWFARAADLFRALSPADAAPEADRPGAPGRAASAEGEATDGR